MEVFLLPGMVIVLGIPEVNWSFVKLFLNLRVLRRFILCGCVVLNSEHTIFSLIVFVFDGRCVGRGGSWFVMFEELLGLH